MNWLRNLSLSIKINMVIAVAMGILAIAILAVETLSTEALIDNLGHFRVEQEVVLVERNLEQMQQELETAATLFANTPGLVQAVATHNRAALRTLVLSALPALEVNDFDIIDANGERLIDTESAQADDESGENDIIRQALLGIQRTTLIAEERDGKVELQLVSIRFLRDENATIVGGLLIARTLNGEFLNTLNFSRDGIELSLIYDDEVISDSTPLTADAETDQENHEVEDIPLKQELMTVALAGNSAINPEVVFSETGVPHTEAYIPVKGLDDRQVASVLVIRVNNDTIATFQRALVRDSGIVLIVLTLIIIGVFTIIIQAIGARRIRILQRTATAVAQGNYSERVRVGGQDELGKLGHAFNQMARAIEFRDQRLAQQLQETDEAREKAERSDQVKSAFLASMSHELRTPLNAVINFTKFVAQGDLGPVNEQQEEALFESIDSAKHLLSLINDVLDMSKIEAGSLSLFVQDNVNLNEILKSAISTTSGLIQDKPVEILTDIPEDLPLMRGDQQRLRQIFLNILSNACKFTEEGAIYVKAHHLDGAVEITIKDTGPGIAAEDIPLVFEPFKQTSAGLRQGGGTGLGMPITKNLVTVHGGQIWIDSEVGNGATFHVALPVKSEALKPLAI